MSRPFLEISCQAISWGTCEHQPHCVIVSSHLWTKCNPQLYHTPLIWRNFGFSRNQIQPQGKRICPQSGYTKEQTKVSESSFKKKRILQSVLAMLSHTYEFPTSWQGLMCSGCCFGFQLVRELSDSNPAWGVALHVPSTCGLQPSV